MAEEKVPSIANKLFFDGSCAGPTGSKEGAGGMALYDHQDTQIEGKGEYYGPDIATNNQAEAHALLRALVYLEANKGMITGCKEVVVMGDSKLIIDYMTGCARPSSPPLFRKVKEIRALLRRMRYFNFCWVQIPHGDNQVADWLANEARKNKAPVLLSALGMQTAPKGEIRELRR